MSVAPEFATAAAAEVRRQRRALAAPSPKKFAQIYLAASFNEDFCAMHEEVFAELAAFGQRRGSHLAIAAPRGHAKSTIVTLAYVLWCMVYNKEPFIVLLSDRADQASQLLNHVKRQIETNPLLREDFSELTGAQRAAPWRKDSILLPNGAMLMSYSAGQNLRGTRHGKHRPTLIIADDVEDKLQVASEEQRLKLAQWFNSTALKAGTPNTNVIVVGTVLHHDSLLANLLDPARSPGWKGMRYQAVVEFSDRPDLWEKWAAIIRGQEQHQGRMGDEAAREFIRAQGAAMRPGKTLWPDVYSYRNLMTTRLREGEAAFQAEYQNQPLDPQMCIFAGAKMIYWDDQHQSAEHLIAAHGGPSGGSFYGACDPSLGGNPTRGDYTAIIVLFEPHRSDVRYVIAADLARRTPDQTIQTILQLARMYRFTDFGVEANQFQQLLVDQLKAQARAQGKSLPVTPLKNRANKQQRIAALEAEVSQGKLVFSRRHQLLLEQLRAFPLGKHDDGPDALEMAVNTATEGGDWYQECGFDGTIYYDSRFGGSPPPDYYRHR